MHIRLIKDSEFPLLIFFLWTLNSISVLVSDCLFSGFRVPVTPTVSSVLPDHHQSAAAVLCPAGQELPVLLPEGEDSECYVAPWLPPSLSAPRRFTALSTLPSLWSSWIFNLPLLPTFQLLPLVVFLVSFHLLLHWLLFLALGIFFALEVKKAPAFLASTLDSFVSFSSRVCWWTTSSRWGSCWRRCLNQWEPNRWDAVLTTVTCPISWSKDFRSVWATTGFKSGWV